MAALIAEMSRKVGDPNSLIPWSCKHMSTTAFETRQRVLALFDLRGLAAGASTQDFLARSSPDLLDERDSNESIGIPE